MAARPWRCRACLSVNPVRTRKCGACAKPRPARRRPKHLVALELSYEAYVELNGGEHCGVCWATPTAGRRLDRDHDHRTGQPRGLLCHRCNRALASWVTTKWAQAAAAYLERAAA